MRLQHAASAAPPPPLPCPPPPLQCDAAGNVCTECTWGRSVPPGGVQCSLNCKVLWGISCKKCSAAACLELDPAYPSGAGGGRLWDWERLPEGRGRAAAGAGSQSHGKRRPSPARPAVQAGGSSRARRACGACRQACPQCSSPLAQNCQSPATLPPCCRKAVQLAGACGGSLTPSACPPPALSCTLSALLPQAAACHLQLPCSTLIRHLSSRSHLHIPCIARTPSFLYFSTVNASEPQPCSGGRTRHRITPSCRLPTSW